MGECSSFSCIVEILNECGKGIEFRGCSVPVVNQKLKGLRVTIRLKLLLDFVEDGGLIIVYGIPCLLQLQPFLVRKTVNLRRKVCLIRTFIVRYSKTIPDFDFCSIVTSDA